MKRARRWVIALTIMALLSTLFLRKGDAPGAMVTRAKSTQQQIDEKTQERDELINQKNEIQEGIDGLKVEQKTLKGQLNRLNSQLAEVSENLEELEGQISDKKQEIADTQSALEQAIAVEEEQYANMVLRVRKMYEKNDTGGLNIFLDSVYDISSFADNLNTADSFEKIVSYDKRKLDEFKENRRFIEEEKKRLEQEKKELDDLYAKAEEEKNKVSGMIADTSSSISVYAGQISQEEKKALAYEEQIREKEKDLDYLWKKLAEEQALSKDAANGVWRDISEINFADGDRRLLANLIYCEAGAEPYAGQLAVGSVVINRVLSDKFPDTVVGVIYQNRQFSPVASGRLSLALASDRATDKCYQAADESMKGVNNIGTCVFFRTPIEGLEGTRIGGHIFY